MAQQILNPNSLAPNDKLGDTPWDYTIKLNSNITELYSSLGAQPENVVVINQESDFPVQDGTTITLGVNTAYWIGGEFSTAKTIVGDGSVLFSAGSTISPLITYTGTGSMFRVTNTRITIKDITVDCPNGTLLEINGNGSGSLLQRMNLSNVTCNSCSKIASFNNAAALILDTVNVISVTGSSGFTFVGTNIGLLSFSRMGIFGLIPSATCFDFGTSVSFDIELLNIILGGDSSATAISGAPNSANVTAGDIAEVSGCNFNTFSTPLSGIMVNDIRWDFQSNAGLAPSRNAADIYLDGGAETVITGAAGDWQEIGTPVAVGVTWISDIADRFTIGLDGVITYIGEEDIEARLTGRATVEKVGGGANVLEVRFAINWDGTPSDSGLKKSRSQTQATSPTTVPIGALTCLSPNDNVRAIFSNTDGTSNIIASVASLEVTG